MFLLFLTEAILLLFLQQADYSRYFENIGEPSPVQQYVSWFFPFEQRIYNACLEADVLSFEWHVCTILFKDREMMIVIYILSVLYLIEQSNAGHFWCVHFFRRMEFLKFSLQSIKVKSIQVPPRNSEFSSIRGNCIEPIFFYMNGFVPRMWTDVFSFESCSGCSKKNRWIFDAYSLRRFGCCCIPICPLTALQRLLNARQVKMYHMSLHTEPFNSFVHKLYT